VNSDIKIEDELDLLENDDEEQGLLKQITEKYDIQNENKKFDKTQ